MTSTNNNLSEALTSFTQQYIKNYQESHHHLPLVESDNDWLSKCIVAQHDQQFSTWQPYDMGNSLDFDNIDSALDISLHPDIKAYFTLFYSDEIPAQCSEGGLSLLFAWNDEDFKRLQENIIGHILMKQKLKQEITVFFAVTDEEDMILSVMNDTGEVWVEQVGCKPHKKVANSLVEFIEQLTPDIGDVE